MPPLDPRTFLDRLLTRVPEAGPVVREHVEDHDGLLIHLLMPDLLRLATRLFHSGDLEAEHRLLDVVDEALVHGDEALGDAVLVSFVEGVGAWPGETPDFVATWPEALQAAARRHGLRSPGSGDR